MYYEIVLKIVNSIVLSIFLTAGMKFGIPINQEIKNIGLTVSSNKEWTVEIPEINLKANISNGTDEETMNKYVGHFTETFNVKGNVGLAAHNRGYPVNYFKDLNKLKLGDSIYYTYFGIKKVYTIINIQIIEDTNWNVLESKNKDEITLITCIANKPEYRLCIKGIRADVSLGEIN